MAHGCHSLALDVDNVFQGSIFERLMINVYDNSTGFHRVGEFGNGEVMMEVLCIIRITILGNTVERS